MEDLRFSQRWLWRMSFPGLWRCTHRSWINRLLEDRIASIFRVDSDWCSVCSHLLTLVPRSRIFLPWRWRRNVPPKRRLTQDLHSTISHKTTFFKNMYCLLGRDAVHSNTYDTFRTKLLPSLYGQFISNNLLQKFQRGIYANTTHKIIIPYINLLVFHVEAGSNTSTVALRVPGGDGKGTQCPGV
jgi:hypothetical protein